MLWCLRALGSFRTETNAGDWGRGRERDNGQFLEPAMISPPLLSPI